MPAENPGQDLDETLRAERFDTMEAVIAYLSSLKIDPSQFRESSDGHLLSVSNNLLTETDPDTGKTRFSQAGINATAEWIEDLGSAPDCFWGN